MQHQHYHDSIKVQKTTHCSTSSCPTSSSQVQRRDGERTHLPPLNHLQHQAAHQIGAQLINRSQSMSTSSSPTPPRRLNSGSACETCRRRKTKCDGGHPCAFCAANRIGCIHRPTRKKKTTRSITSRNESWQMDTGHISSPTSSTGDDLKEDTILHSLSKQASCPSLNTMQPSTTLDPTKKQNNDRRSIYPTFPYSSASNTILREDPIPSMIDQLSCRTFLSAVDQRQNFPIYPLAEPALLSSDDPRQRIQNHKDQHETFSS